MEISFFLIENVIGHGLLSVFVGSSSDVKFVLCIVLCSLWSVPVCDLRRVVCRDVERCVWCAVLT